MVSDEERGGGGHSGSGRPGALLGRLLFRVATQLFGGRVDMASEPERKDEERAETAGPEPAPAQPVAEAARILERALAQVESMLGGLEEREERPAPAKERGETVPQELTELQRALREVVRQLEGALAHLGLEARRLSDEASRLSLVADRLEARLGGLTGAPRQGVPPVGVELTPEPEPALPREPQYSPGEQAVGIVIAAVPGFQGLMDVQRGLSGLTAVEGASVRRYQNGEAALEVVLRAPLTAREIVESLHDSTGHQLFIEEARPEASRLRLRFADHKGQGFGVGPRPGIGPNG